MTEAFLLKEKSPLRSAERTFYLMQNYCHATGNEAGHDNHGPDCDSVDKDIIPEILMINLRNLLTEHFIPPYFFYYLNKLFLIFQGNKRGGSLHFRPVSVTEFCPKLCMMRGLRKPLRCAVSATPSGAIHFGVATLGLGPLRSNLNNPTLQERSFCSNFFRYFTYYHI
jgi:hypothetical protein